MAQEAKAIVPAGKEDEYSEDVQGRAIHMKYGNDSVMRGTVLPSGKDRIHSGGSHGFNIDEMDIPQNIIAYEEGGQRTITTVTRRELIAADSLAKAGAPVATREVTPEAIEALGERAEDIYARAGELLKTGLPQPAATLMAKVAAIAGAHHNPFEGEPMAMKKATVKKKAKRKKAKRKSRRVVESAPEPEQQQVAKEQAAPPEPVTVKLTTPFGVVEARVSGIFRDGMCLVMYTDERQLPAVYQPPETEDPIALAVEFEGHKVACIWAGIGFTMPNSPVTFIVLLVVEEAEEEQADGENGAGEAGFDTV